MTGMRDAWVVGPSHPPAVPLLVRVVGLVWLLLILVSMPSCAAPRPDAGDPGTEPSRPIHGEPEPPSLEPIVFPNPRAVEGGAGGPMREGRPVGEEDAGWREKLDLARGYAAGGYDDQAQEIIRATLAQDPPAPWRPRFIGLRTMLRERRMQRELLRVDARGRKDYVVFGADVDWLVRIRNVSPCEIVFPAPPGGGDAVSPSILSLSVRRRDVDIYGAELSRSWNQTIPLQRVGGRALCIPPGGIHEVTVRIPAADVGEAISGLKILDLSGTLRGTMATEDSGKGSVRLRARPGRVVVLPGGYEPLAQDPLGSMETAMRSLAPMHLLIAAEFVPRGQGPRAAGILASVLAEGDPALRTAALGALGLLRGHGVGQPLAPFVGPLMEALESHPERSEPVMEGLTRLSGQALARDPRIWRDWWRRVGQQGMVVPPQEHVPIPGGAREKR